MVAQQLQFKWDRPSSSKGEACGEEGKVCQVVTASERSEPVKTVMMEEVVRRENLIRALKRVCANKGSPGVDGMTLDELKDYLKVYWPDIREKLRKGEYRPQAVKQVLLPKSGGGTRKLGIPTVLDRFIQQALLQVLNPIYDSTFSEHSYGFRPGRNAHQAVGQAKKYIEEGHERVVDIDLEKCFDQINHDILMGRIAKRVADKRILRLIRHYLQAGIMVHGVVQERYKGTPQGGPLSPLLSNILLDELELNTYLRGWLGYYRLIEASYVLEELDWWIRRRMQCFVMNQWIKKCSARYKGLRNLGVSDKSALSVAFSQKGPWVISNMKPVKVAMPNNFFAERGLLSLASHYESLSKTT